MYPKVPGIVKWCLPQLIWEVPTNKKEIFLTFDDGPHPEVTVRVMEILKDYQARATFFCVGENVKKYPEVYEAILQNGHQVGNHTFNHLNGWKTSSDEYYANIEKCSEFVDSTLFRPPYGRVSLRQIPYLKKKYRIVMWSVLSLDYDKRVTREKVLYNSISNTRAGSIVVFHDSLKASDNMFYALPAFLDHFTKRGFVFSTL